MASNNGVVTRQTSWLALCLQSEPDFYRNSRHLVEYEFTAPSGGREPTHERGLRVFKADYTKRGAYTPDE